MKVELYCPHCFLHFTASSDTPQGEALDLLTEKGPWSVLGDGETYEDAIVATLHDRGLHRCPRCGKAGTVDEESLGRLTREILYTW